MTDDCTNDELIDLSGRRALVTGAAKGIGAAIAARLAAAGAHVTIADLDDPTGRATADGLIARGLSASLSAATSPTRPSSPTLSPSQPATAPWTSS